jgi:hypothetical protein
MAKPITEPELDEATVAAWLAAHPHFLAGWLVEQRCPQAARWYRYESSWARVGRSFLQQWADAEAAEAAGTGPASGLSALGAAMGFELGDEYAVALEARADRGPMVHPARGRVTDPDAVL